MSEDQNWQPPGGSLPPGSDGFPPPAGDPGAAPYPPPAGASGPGWTPYPPSAGGWGPGWTPPPKPGLIPLRPLTFGTLMGAPFLLIRRNPRVTIGASLLVSGIPRAIVSILSSAGAALLLGRVAMAAAGYRQEISAGAVAGEILIAVLGVALSLVSAAVLQGIIVSETARACVGERLTVRELWQRCRGRIGALIGWSLLIVAAFAVAVLVLAVVIAVLIPLGVVGGILAGLTGFFGFAAIVVLAVWIGTKLALVPSAIVLERAGIRHAMRRSWALSRGSFWRVLGVIVLIALIVGGVQEVAVAPISLVGTFSQILSHPTELSGAGAAAGTSLVTPATVIAALVGAAVGAILQVASAAAPALLYLDLRMRKEGLDLQLVRFVEARQTGEPARDPFPAPQRAARTVPEDPGPAGAPE